MINSPDVFVGQKELDVATQFLQAIKDHDFSKSTEITDILIVLDQLSMRFGYTIGSYLCFWCMDTYYALYPHRIDADEVFVPSYEYETYTLMRDGTKGGPLWKVVAPFTYNPKNIIVGEQDISLAKYLPSIFQYVHVPYTKEGIWQLYLLYIATKFFPRGGHPSYGIRKCILSLEDMDSINEVDCSAYRNESVLPCVYFIDSNRAIVECCYFNDWRGLCREYVCFDKSNGFFEMSQTEYKVLVQYNCGVKF